MARRVGHICAKRLCVKGRNAFAGLEAEEPEQAADPATAEEPYLAPTEDMLCKETALEPEENGKVAGCSALEGTAPGSEQKATPPRAQHDSGSLMQADAVPSTSLRKESPSPAGAAAALDEGVASPEAPAVPKGQRGKRSSRKRAASVLWGSSDAEDRSAPAGRSEAVAGMDASAAPVPAAKPEDTLDNDAAIARALAGESSASLVSHPAAQPVSIKPRQARRGSVSLEAAFHPKYGEPCTP